MFKTLPNAPAVVTKAASGVTQTTATLNATVNPEGGEVSDCKFEYGTTEAYGSSASCTPENRGSGTSPVAVSATLERRAEHDLPLQDLGDQRGRYQQRLRRQRSKRLPRVPVKPRLSSGRDL